MNEKKNREIKFRAWDKVFGHMHDVHRVETDEGGNLESITVSMVKGSHQYQTWTDLKNVIVMQYTGMKDANGCKIYEGDYVKLWLEKVPFLVSYSEERAAFQITGGRWPITKYMPAPSLIKVVGNMYENPEIGERILEAQKADEPEEEEEREAEAWRMMEYNGIKEILDNYCSPSKTENDTWIYTIGEEWGEIKFTIEDFEKETFLYPDEPCANRSLFVDYEIEVSSYTNSSSDSLKGLAYSVADDLRVFDFASYDIETFEDRVAADIEKLLKKVEEAKELEEKKDEELSPDQRKLFDFF